LIFDYQTPAQHVSTIVSFLSSAVVVQFSLVTTSDFCVSTQLRTHAA